MLSIAGANDEDVQIFGAAAALFVVLGALVWWRRSRLLWGAVVAVQLLMGWMPSRSRPASAGALRPY